MSIIQRDYLPERKEPAFPRELAVLIAKRAQALAAQLEGKAITQLTTAARRSLRAGLPPDEVARQLGLDCWPSIATHAVALPWWPGTYRRNLPVGSW